MLANMNTDGQHVSHVAEDPLTPQHGGPCSCEGGRRTSEALAAHSNSDPSAKMAESRSMVESGAGGENVEAMTYGQTASFRHAPGVQRGWTEAPEAPVRPRMHPKAPTLNPKP